MYKSSEFTKPSYRTGEVADILGVSRRTVQNYAESGRLKTYVTQTNRRIILREDILSYLDQAGLLERDDDVRRDIIYVRSEKEGREGVIETDRQVAAIVAKVSELKNHAVICDCGVSADDDTRKGLCEILEMVKNKAVRRIYIVRKDVLSGVSFRTLKTMFAGYGTEIIVIDEKF
jgi:excisionase family DNA binding protein